MRRFTTPGALTTLILSLATAAGCDDDGAKSGSTATSKASPTATAGAATTAKGTSSPGPVSATPGAGTAAPAARSGSPFDAVCYGEKELTDEQRYDIQAKNADGKDPCPGFAAPTMLINADGITINGQALVPKDKLPDADNLAQIEPLFKRLSLLRKRWKSFFPTKPFAGKLTIKPAAGTASAPVISAFITAGRAGYQFVRIEAGSLRVDLTHFYPGPPGEKSAKQALYLEPLESGKAVAGVLETGPKLESKKELASLSEVDDWLKSTCSGKPVPSCTERLVFRARKVPIEETVKTLQTLLQAKSLGSNTIPIALEFGCGVSPKATRQEIMDGPWGPRSPDGPCF